MKKTAVILVNLGSPEALSTAGIRRFLRTFLSDRRVVNLPRFLWLPILYFVILPFRPKKLLQEYAAIWSEHGSPLIAHTQLLSTTLQSVLPSNFVVKAAMRYGQPSLRTVLTDLQERHIDNFIILPLYPQYHTSTTASIFDHVTDIVRHWPKMPNIQFISDYYRHPAYIDAIVQSIEHYQQSHDTQTHLLLFSFHGVPLKSLEKGDPYLNHCRETVNRVTEQLGIATNQWRLVFQSRFGPAKWLSPDCAETLSLLPTSGVKKVQVVCPGFALDCLETLVEINMTNRQLFLTEGGQQFDYIPALGNSDLHVNALLQILQDAATSFTLKHEVNTTNRETFGQTTFNN